MVATSESPFPVPTHSPALLPPAFYTHHPTVNIVYDIPVVHRDDRSRPADLRNASISRQIACSSSFFHAGNRMKLQIAVCNPPKEVQKPSVVLTILYHVITLGIVKVYHSKLAYRASRPVRAGSVGLGSIATLPTHWHAAGGTPNWEQTRGLIQISWTASATLSSLALTVDTAFVQLIASCTDEFFKTVALSALILLLASLACGVLYTGYGDSFAGPGREAEWQEATASDSPFWVLMALPALFLTWAFACSVLAVLYLSFSASCAGPCQSGACGTAIGMPLFISRVFFALVVAASLGLVCFAMRTVRGHAMQ